MAGARRSYWRWIAGIGIAFALLSAVAISQAGRFFEAPASAPSPADLLVALGGETGDRALTAASLFKGGFAPRMLVVIRDSLFVIGCSIHAPRATYHEPIMEYIKLAYYLIKY